MPGEPRRLWLQRLDEWLMGWCSQCFTTGKILQWGAEINSFSLCPERKTVPQRSSTMWLDWCPWNYGEYQQGWQEWKTVTPDLTPTRCFLSGLWALWAVWGTQYTLVSVDGPWGGVFDTNLDTGKTNSSPSPKTPFLCTSYIEDIIFLSFPTGMLGPECWLLHFQHEFPECVPPDEHADSCYAC